MDFILSLLGMVDAGTRCDSHIHTCLRQHTHGVKGQGNALTGTSARQVGQVPRLYRPRVLDRPLREVISDGGVPCFTTSTPPPPGYRC